MEASRNFSIFKMAAKNVGKSRTKARSRVYLLNDLVECLHTHSYSQNDCAVKKEGSLDRVETIFENGMCRIPALSRNTLPNMVM